MRLQAIAHAGGAVNGKTYTNSIAALKSNILKGFTWFEIDFEWTSDGVLVCGHDWSTTFQNNYGVAMESAPSFKEFSEMLAGQGDAPCTLNALIEWLEENPRIRLITDFKRDTLKGLERLAALIPNHAERIIPQIYQPEEYQQVRSLGYREMIWTLYRFAGSTRDVLEVLTGMQLTAVSMPEERVRSGLGLLLQEVGLPVYVHTINDMDVAQKYRRDWGVTAIYTDVLALSEGE